MISLEDAVKLVWRAFCDMKGGEIYVKKIPSMTVVDMASAVNPDSVQEEVGIRPGEKLHEVMIPKEEIRNTIDMGQYFIIQPNHHWWNISDFKKAIEIKGKVVSGMQEYASNTNATWMRSEQISDLLDKLNSWRQA